MNGGVSGAGEGRASTATAAATSLIRPLSDWVPAFRLNLWPEAAAAAAEVVGRRVTFDPLLYFLLWLLCWSRENKRRTTA